VVGVFGYGSIMPEQLRKTSQSKESVSPVVESTATATSSSKNLKADLDSLLDEIDEVLESNAEEFVNSYVQKGGQ
jgi:ubiquitin-like protein Pup